MKTKEFVAQIILVAKWTLAATIITSNRTKTIIEKHIDSNLIKNYLLNRERPIPLFTTVLILLLVCIFVWGIPVTVFLLNSQGRDYSVFALAIQESWLKQLIIYCIMTFSLTPVVKMLFRHYYRFAELKKKFEKSYIERISALAGHP